jgi:hypothetical protein
MVFLKEFGTPISTVLYIYHTELKKLINMEILKPEPFIQMFAPEFEMEVFI